MADFFCICEEEWCWCMNRVGSPEEACDECAKGNHTWEPPQ